MRIALLSDIHSNVYALDAVLHDVFKESVDVVVNLGDILYGPIEPRATFNLLMENEIVTIRGNQDRQIYEARGTELTSNPTLQFIFDDLGEEPLSWVKGLPPVLQYTDDVFFCHGTPDNDLVYLLEDASSGKPELRADAEIINLLSGNQSHLICCGHTHLARSVLTSSNQLIVNPGSVGLPAYQDDEPWIHAMQSYSYHASYAIVEGQGDKWNVSFKRVDYDKHKAIDAALKRNRTHWAQFLSTGRVAV
ncbi:metallophosphoesterase family protein [Enterovibrio coralii]|uniref:Serine/threonine protein phosphatase n=1 Tax=Enterovibrio coralii TaxID=294935 RepID=A0A135I646_9GAMM|nr:metallophosphoesterase family protein [Enterovibrio coralii]KXF80912.1 serine/threonine protein phosphatase [Enterovibrio coralii]